MLTEPAPGRSRLGVLGWPVAHSLSPQLQNAALQAAGLDHWRYQRLPVPPAWFAETVRALPGAGFRGVNVTIPHKAAALAVADRASPRARQIGAANTLVFEAGGEISAENTDAPALLAALPEAVEGRSAVVLGAGGSARAVLWALLSAGAHPVEVWNRTPERARALCAELGGEAVTRVSGADLLVNCTAIGLKAGDGLGELPVGAPDLGGFRCLVDFVYRPGGTELTRAARAAGLAVVDGLELLAGQGELSFALFTGVPAPAGVMLAAARQAAERTGRPRD